MAYKAIVVGGSGLIGRKLINILCQRPEYDEVVSLGRKKLSLQYHTLRQVKINFDQLEDHAEEIKGHAVFCCLGSTRKKTPNQRDYRVIDYDYPVKLASIATKNRVEQFHLVSSIGADKESSNFYLKIKGETQEAVKATGLNCLYIYEPSVLVGQRYDRRLIEEMMGWLMKILNPLLLGGLKKYRSIPAYVVAMAMFNRSLKIKTGTFTYTTEKIKQLT